MQSVIFTLLIFSLQERKGFIIMVSSLTKGSVAVLFSLLLLAGAGAFSGAAAAQAEAAGAEDLGYGVGAVATSMLYTPLKVAYAGVGLVAGGVGYVVTGGREDVANDLIQPAIGGNYVINANQLKGREPVVFVGPRARR